MWLVVLLACRPGWVEECGCGSGQVCRVNPPTDTDAACVDIPAECGLGDQCGSTDLDDACREALCGAGAEAVGFSLTCSQGFDGSTAWKAHCAGD
jgi:hypothetical protein